MYSDKGVWNMFPGKESCEILTMTRSGWIETLFISQRKSGPKEWGRISVSVTL